MNGKFIVVTGVPGVGKTTITRKLEASFRPVTRIGFGDLIFETIDPRGDAGSYEQLRSNPYDLITPKHVSLAEKLLIKRLRVLRPITNVLLDSHAVVSSLSGLRVIPEITDFSQAKPDAVIVVHAPFEIVERRLVKSPSGRRLGSRKSFDDHEHVQDAVAVGFSLMSSCPMYVINTDDSLERSVRLFTEIFESINMNFDEANVQGGSNS